MFHSGKGKDMSNINTVDTALESAASTEKELQLVKQQTEMKAGEALLRETSRALMEQKEKRAEKKEQEQPRDTAEISERHRAPRTGKTISESGIAGWCLEMQGKDWEAFLNWQPDPDEELSKQLQELSRLYLTLLEAVLKYAEGENLAEQLGRLDALLAQKLNLLMEQELAQLISLLEQTGQTEAADRVRAGLYRQTAGRTLSPRAAHALFSQGTSVRGRNSGTAAGGSAGGTGRETGIHRSAGHALCRGSSASSSLSDEGMIYQSSGKQNVRFQQTYHIQQSSWKEQIRQRNEVIRSARSGIAENTFQKGSARSCSGNELKMANRFAAHINSGGNLFKNPAISARNEEVTGLLAAVMSIKGQVYAGEAGQRALVARPLQDVIEKMIDLYLNRKGASAVYYHTLTVYKQTKDPKKAIRDGQEYACRQFREKQKDPAYQKSAPYAKESGFFRILLKGLSPEKEFALGVHVLQKDWQDFLSAIGKGTSGLSEMERHSPWRAVAGMGKQRAGGGAGAGRMGKFLLGAAAFLLLGVLAAVFLRIL